MRRNFKKTKYSLYYSNRNQGILLGLLVFVFFFTLSTGYGLLNTTFGISTDFAVRPNRDIRIMNIGTPAYTNGAYETSEAYYSHNELNIVGVLPNSNSTIEYILIVTNSSDVDKTLDDLSYTFNISGYDIELPSFQVGDEIPAGESIELKVKLKRGSSVSNTTFNAELDFAFGDAYVDITPPTIIFDPVATNSWLKDDTVVKLSATDDRTINSFKYCTTNDGTECVPEIDGEVSGVDITLSEGKNVICATAIDNYKIPNTTTKCSEKYLIDKTAPVISVGGNTSNYEVTIYNTGDNYSEWMTKSELETLGKSTNDAGIESKVQYGYQEVQTWSNNYGTTMPSDGYYTSKTQYKLTYSNSNALEIKTGKLLSSSWTSPSFWGGIHTISASTPIMPLKMKLIANMYQQDGGGAISIVLKVTYKDNTTFEKSLAYLDSGSYANTFIVELEPKELSKVEITYGSKVVVTQSDFSIIEWQEEVTTTGITDWQDSNTTSLGTVISMETRTVYAQPLTWGTETGWRNGTAYAETTSRKSITRKLYRYSNVNYEIPLGTVTDNFTENITVTSSGSVSPTIVGSYPITYTATDLAGNTSTLILTVKVITRTYSEWMTSTELANAGYSTTDPNVQSKVQYGYQDVATWSTSYSTTAPSDGYYTSKTQYNLTYSNISWTTKTGNILSSSWTSPSF